MSFETNRWWILHTAIAMTADERINLASFRSPSLFHINNGISNLDVDVHFVEGTDTACMGGIAATIPMFNAEGLTYNTATKCVVFEDEEHYLMNFDALAKFFNIDVEAAKDLFCPGPASRVDETVEYAMQGEKDKWSDKRIALRRIRRLMLKTGVISELESKRMKKFEINVSK